MSRPCILIPTHRHYHRPNTRSLAMPTTEKRLHNAIGRRGRSQGQSLMAAPNVTQIYEGESKGQGAEWCTGPQKSNMICRPRLQHCSTMKAVTGCSSSVMPLYCCWYLLFRWSGSSSHILVNETFTFWATKRYHWGSYLEKQGLRHDFGWAPGASLVMIIARVWVPKRVCCRPRNQVM